MTQRGINVYRPARFEHLLKWSRFHGEDHLLWNEYYKKKRLCEKYSEDKKLKFYSVCAIKKKKRLKSKLFFQLIGYDMMFPVWETLSRQLTHKQLKKKGISCRESKIVHPLKWHFSAVPTMIVFVCFSSKFPFEGPVKLITVVQRWLFYLCLAFPELQTRKFLQWCRSRAVKEHRKCFTPVYVYLTNYKSDRLNRKVRSAFNICHQCNFIVKCNVSRWWIADYFVKLHKVNFIRRDKCFVCFLLFQREISISESARKYEQFIFWEIWK